ncbi:hypothetical protein PR048_009287 [Dryococelus australis]|uniref:Uncharacterized protein n=1 Tax=Dryococelus australis TaxID=614101 RepID=A0ABQ9HZH6_9NEOP|nr:hypothetical protein PR048_009287 [Dryococelus australis]
MLPRTNTSGPTLKAVKHKSTDVLSYLSSRRGRGGVVVRLLASHLSAQGSIRGGIAPGLSQVGIVLDDAAGRRVFSGICHFPTLSFQRCSTHTLKSYWCCNEPHVFITKSRVFKDLKYRIVLPNTSGYSHHFIQSRLFLSHDTKHFGSSRTECAVFAGYSTRTDDNLFRSIPEITLRFQLSKMALTWRTRAAGLPTSPDSAPPRWKSRVDAPQCRGAVFSHGPHLAAAPPAVNTQSSRWLARSPPIRRSGLDSRRVRSQIFVVGIVPNDAVCRRDFSGVSRFPHLHSGAALFSTPFTIIGSSDLDVRSRPNLSTTQTYLTLVVLHPYNSEVVGLMRGYGERHSKLLGSSILVRVTTDNDPTCQSVKPDIRVACCNPPCFLIGSGSSRLPLFGEARPVCSNYLPAGPLPASKFERLDRSSPTTVNRVQPSAGHLPDFRKWEPCRMIPLVSRFSPGYPVIPALTFWRCCNLTLFHPHRLSYILGLESKSLALEPKPESKDHLPKFVGLIENHPVYFNFSHQFWNCQRRGGPVDSNDCFASDCAPSLCPRVLRSSRRAQICDRHVRPSSPSPLPHGTLDHYSANRDGGQFSISATLIARDSGSDSPPKLKINHGH